MPSSLHALMVEDNVADREMILHELDKAGFETDWKSAASEAELIARLSENWDLILLDYHIPQFDALRALRLFRERHLDIPVIVITGLIGDEAAAQCMKEGATDYLLKDRLARLGPAVHAALRQHDLEAQKRQADRQVRESEARLRALTEAMPQIVWTAEPDGSIDYFNEPWFEYTGLPRQSAEQSDWRRAIHSDDLPELLAECSTFLRDSDRFEIECRIRRAYDGQYRWHLTRAVAVSDAAGKIVRWYGTTTDIHDRKVAEQALERSNSALRQFAYAAGHDLQEPLRNVATSSEMLNRKLHGKLEEETAQLLKANIESARRMHRMVKGLLSYTRVGEDSPEAPPTANAAEALSQALHNLAEAIDEADAKVTHAVLPQLPAHEVHLVQLFQNLISNSLKYRSPDRKPEIQVAAERRGKNWVLTVRDNGIGFDPFYKERIFGLFKRLHTQNQYTGTGIGLAICSRIVQHYDGKIWASSELGQGATFSFALPAGESQT